MVDRQAVERHALGLPSARRGVYPGAALVDVAVDRGLSPGQ